MLGLDSVRDHAAILRRTGSLIETPIFYEHLSAADNLRLHLAYMGIEDTDVEPTLCRVGVIVDGTVVQEAEMADIRKQHPSDLEDYLSSLIQGGGDHYGTAASTKHLQAARKERFIHREYVIPIDCNFLNHMVVSSLATEKGNVSLHLRNYHYRDENAV